MKLSLRLSSDIPSEFVFSLGGVVADLQPSRMWIAENAFQRSALICATALRGNHGDLPIGIGTANVRARHPMLLAQDVASLIDLVGGPLILGLGLGLDGQRKALGLPRPSGLETMDHAIDTLTTLTSGKAVRGLDGGGEVTLALPPSTVPIVVGAIGPRMTEIAAKKANGILYSVGATVSYLDTSNRLIESLRNDSTTSFSVGRVAYVYYCGDRSWSDVALSIKPSILRLLSLARTTPSMLRLFEGLVSSQEDVDALVRNVERSGFAAMPDEFVDAVALWGPADQCVRQLRAYEEVGIDEVALAIGAWTGDYGAASTPIRELLTAWSSQ